MFSNSKHVCDLGKGSFNNKVDKIRCGGGQKIAKLCPRMTPNKAQKSRNGFETMGAKND